eukprot:GHVH01005594.1.p1 GENE.GHVH01005594.1~~GHVH01005594.1.p1  ORF type:complete len:256 (-),score=37.03 GHVH01005594.1:308-1075(-)
MKKKAEEIAEGLKLKGNNCFSNGQYMLAIEYYSEAIEHNPEDGKLWTNRANAHSKLGDWKSTERDARSALNYDELSAKAYFFLGKALLENGDIEESIKKLKKGLIVIEAKFGARAGDQYVLYSEIESLLHQSYFASHARQEACIVDCLEDSIQTLQAKDGGSERYSVKVLSQELDSIRDRKLPDHLCCPITYVRRWSLKPLDRDLLGTHARASHHSIWSHIRACSHSQLSDETPSSRPDVAPVHDTQRIDSKQSN